MPLFLSLKLKMKRKIASTTNNPKHQRKFPILSFKDLATIKFKNTLFQLRKLITTQESLNKIQEIILKLFSIIILLFSSNRNGLELIIQITQLVIIILAIYTTFKRIILKLQNLGKKPYKFYNIFLVLKKPIARALINVWQMYIINRKIHIRIIIIIMKVLLNKRNMKGSRLIFFHKIQRLAKN